MHSPMFICILLHMCSPFNILSLSYVFRLLLSFLLCFIPICIHSQCHTDLSPYYSGLISHLLCISVSRVITHICICTRTDTLSSWKRDKYLYMTCVVMCFLIYSNHHSESFIYWLIQWLIKKFFRNTYITDHFV